MGSTAGGGSWRGGWELLSVAEVNDQREEHSGNIFHWLFWSLSKYLRAGKVTKPELHQEGPRASDCLLLPGQSSRFSMALQKSTGLDVYQTYFEPTAYLGYLKMGQRPVDGELLHFLLKCYTTTFKSGADLLEPWKRFVGGRAGMQILN